MGKEESGLLEIQSILDIILPGQRKSHVCCEIPLNSWILFHLSKTRDKKQFRNGLLFAGAPLLWVHTMVLPPHWSSHHWLGAVVTCHQKPHCGWLAVVLEGQNRKLPKPASPPGLARLCVLSLSQLPRPLVCSCCFPEALYFPNSSDRDKPIPMATETQKMGRVCSSGHPQPVSVEASRTLAQLGAQGGDTFGD